MATILYGTQLSKEITTRCQEKIAAHQAAGHRSPNLSVLLIGSNPASKIYVNSKQKKAMELHMDFALYEYDEMVTQDEVIAQIHRLNEDNLVDGIFVQMPLPPHLDSDEIIRHIDPDKDVDGLHPVNLGKLVSKQAGLLPCTPAGVIELLKSTDVPLSGKKAVVIGRSILVGKPAALLLDHQDMTVTICHSKTRNIEEECAQADVVVVAVGKPKLVKKHWIKEGAIVIDVGINRLEDGSIVGDVDFEDVVEKTSFITPVPKGVGPMTIAMLMENTYRAYCTHTGVQE